MIVEYRVYMLVFPNEKVYIGVTSKAPSLRWKRGKGYCYNEVMYDDILLFGWDSIVKKIVFRTQDETEAYEKERELIEEYDSTNPNKGYNHGYKGINNSNVDLSDESRRKIGSSLKGRKMSDIARQHMSEGQKRRFSENPKGSLSEETKRKISEVRLAKHYSGYNLGRFGKDHACSKPVLQYTKDDIFVKKFDGMNEAFRETGICACEISRCASGHRKSAGGFIWRLADDKEQ